jgi:hypothetical protein
MPYRIGTLLVAVCILAAACGDDGGEPAADDDTSTTTAPTDDGGSGEDPLPTTLAELLGPAPSLDAGAAQQWYLDREVERQEAMVECMAEAGFDYVPIDPAELADSPWSAEIPWESEEWVGTYGFGASTLRYPQSTVGPDLVGYVDVAEETEPHPNQTYVAGLSADEQAGWTAALNDCDADTWESSQSENLAAAFNEQFGAEVTAMYDALAADPRYEQVHADVQACVQQAGFDYVDHETTLNAIEARLVPLDEQASTGALSPEALAELAAIQSDEVAVATAVADCGGRFLSENADYQDLVAEYEAAFIAEHEEALRAFLDET